EGGPYGVARGRQGPGRESGRGPHRGGLRIEEGDLQPELPRHEIRGGDGDEQPEASIHSSIPGGGARARLPFLYWVQGQSFAVTHDRGGTAGGPNGGISLGRLLPDLAEEALKYGVSRIPLGEPPHVGPRLPLQRRAAPGVARRLARQRGRQHPGRLDARESAVL